MRLGFGRSNGFPLRIGGGDSDVETIYQQLLDDYAPGWDIDDDSEKAAEAYQQALAISMFWIANRRAANQAQPTRMLESLTTWEEAARLRPSAFDPAVSRRNALAAKMRGLADNTFTSIEDACRSLLGPIFVSLTVTAPADELTYWPGINPGPPGFEWSSNRLTLRVQLSKSARTDTDFYVLVGQLEQMLISMIPSIMNFTWNTGTGFKVGISKIGETGL